jgi:hypothetical protein
MAALAMSDRIDRVEEHLKTQDAKLDLIIRLTEAQDEKFKALSEKVEKMAPTVDLGQKVITTANGLTWLGTRLATIAVALVAFFVFMSDRWHLVGQLFRKAG